MNANKKILIAITGLIKSGKTTVADNLRRLGYYVVNVDKFAHKLYARGTKLYKKIIKIFGDKIVKKGGAIDRNKLFLHAFSSFSSYRKFCSIVYPELKKALKEKLNNLKRKVVVVDMAVLFETGFYKDVDFIVFVAVGRKHWIKRVNSFSDTDRIKCLLKYQMIFKLSKKIALSNYIIYNNRGMKELYLETLKLSKKIKEFYERKKRQRN